MDHLLGRVRTALEPQYDVIREIASGGMGVVYLADDPALRRKVAIKVLRPELATAAQAERFLRESRLLARLSHPNVVTIYSAGEADGLFYYVMEYAEGETLATRLIRGPLAERQARSLARDLLVGLEAIHAQGIVHRDLKPGNVLLRADRAMIGDFGIALVDATTSEEAPPSPDAGTVAYMAPEQRLRLPATERSDLYAAGMVVYEAATGHHWNAADRPARADWRGLPPRLTSVLGRALEPAADERWPSARAMRAGLEGRSPIRSALLAGTVGLAAIAIIFLRPSPHRDIRAAGATLVHLAQPVQRSALSDSVIDALATRLGQYTDLRLMASPDEAAITVTPNLVVEASGQIRLAASLSGIRIPTPLGISFTAVPRAEWPAQVDSLADGIMRTLYLGTVDADPWLPRNAIPKRPDGIQAWIRGEQAYNQARWDDALQYYHQAELADSTCLLCTYRLNDVVRWLGGDLDRDRTDRLLAHENLFPPHYRVLIRAYAEPWPARYDSLQAAARRYPDFAIGWFAAADEAFHRATLRGRPRIEAIELLLTTARLKPGFAPAWEHLLWLALARGEQTSATEAIDSLAKAPPATGFSAALHEALSLGYAWRFKSEAEAAAQTDRVLTSPAIVQMPQLAAGARIMMTMGAPAGAVYLGQAFERQVGRRDLVRNGLWGQFFGLGAQNRTEEAGAVAERIRALGQGLETDIFLTEWLAVQSLLRGEPVQDNVAQQLKRLASAADSGSAPATRIQWIGALLDPDLLIPAGLDPASRALLEGIRAAVHGNFAGALGQTAALHPLLEPWPSDPFLPVTLRWFRAKWLERAGRPEAAARELAGYDHLHLDGLPLGEPQAGEVDWATAPLVDWRRASLLAAVAPAGAERCQALGDIARLWRAGSPWARVRADSAVAIAGTACGRKP